ncbi:MAG: YIP1 family protein [Nitrospirota bacterium]
MAIKSSDFTALPALAIRILTSPSEFFRGMPKTGGYAEPLLFVIVMGILGGIIRAFLDMLGLSMIEGVENRSTWLFVLPAAVAAGSFIGAGVLYIIWKLMGSLETYETAYRCSAYISALTPVTTVIDAVPYMGIVASVALSTVFLVIASKEVHMIAARKAWLVFGILGLLFILMNITGQYASKISMDYPERTQNETQGLQKKNRLEAYRMFDKKSTGSFSSLHDVSDMRQNT